MKVVMQDNISLKDLGEVIAAIEDTDVRPHIMRRDGKSIIYVPSGISDELTKWLEHHSAVKAMELFTVPYKLASREYCPDDTVVYAGDVAIGGNKQVIIAGPCAVESEDMVLEAARRVKAAGASILRGGAFKPRTSPYSFRGLGEKGLEILAAARAETGLPVVTEVISPEHVELVAKYVDILQVGARNMQNFCLLERLGDVGKPILLKRGMMSTIEELLMSAEYIISSGNPNIILCERGIRTFERMTRNTLDITFVPVLKEISHLPVIIDPSHATGKTSYVHSASRAGIAAGADGLMLEVHPDPCKALCDGKQSLEPEDFAKLMEQLKGISLAIGRTI